MTIIEDTRNKANKHKLKNDYFAACGDHVTRCKLPFGDYALMLTRSVDTKENIYELAQDINNDHARFKAEIVGAMNAGCKLYILTENTDDVNTLADLKVWLESFEHYKLRLAKNPKAKRINGETLAKACETMAKRYGVQFLFCSPEQSAPLIRKLLKEGGKNG